jgi:hypothetical protein
MCPKWSIRKSKKGLNNGIVLVCVKIGYSSLETQIGDEVL